MTDNSWIEWSACGIAAVAGILSATRGRVWVLAGCLAIAGGWLAGTAQVLLLPALVGLCGCWWLQGRTGRWKKAGLVLALGGILASLLFCWIFPLPVVPALSGPYTTGTLRFELPADGAAPALLAQAWYPSKDDPAAPRAPWLMDPDLAPKFPFHRQRHAFARSRTGVEVSTASAKYPVVFYEHAWNGHIGENVAQAEDLASHGFVVIAVDHPGQAKRVKYADGTVFPTRLADSYELPTEKEVAGFENLMEKCLDQRIADLARIKKALADGVPDRLAGRMLLGKTGVFGFSFGGMTALRLCAVDPSFLAGANEDGMVVGDARPQGPFLFFDEEIPGWLLHEAGPRENAEDALTRRSEMRIRAAMDGGERYRVILNGTLHPAFTDRIFTCRIPLLARVGKRPSDEVHQVICRRLSAFFKREIPSHD